MALAAATAASLLSPALSPAAAQPTEIWSATLTVAEAGTGIVGCQSDSQCASSLTTSSFHSGDFEYFVRDIQYHAGGSTPGLLILRFVTRPYGSPLSAALRGSNFCVGSTAFAIPDSPNHVIYWRNVDLAWSAGDQVPLSIGASCASTTTPVPTTTTTPASTPEPQDTTPQDEQNSQQQQTGQLETVEKPGAVQGLRLATKDGTKVVVRWQAPDAGGAPDRYIVHLKPADGGKGKTKRPNAHRTRSTFRGLEPGKTYQVWVRAQNDAGKGERTHASITLPPPE